MFGPTMVKNFTLSVSLTDRIKNTSPSKEKNGKFYKKQDFLLIEPVLKIKKSVYHGNINFHSDFSRSILPCLRPFLKKPSTTLAHWPGGSKPDGLFAMRRRYSTSSTPSASRVNRTTRSAPSASTAAAVSTPPPPLRPISSRWARNGVRWGSGDCIPNRFGPEYD